MADLVCAAFFCDATLQVHKDVDNNGNQKNKFYHNGKHTLLQGEYDFMTWSRHRKCRLDQYNFWVPEKRWPKWIFQHVQIKPTLFLPSPTVGKIVTRVRSYKVNNSYTNRQVKTFMDKKRKRFTINSAGIRTKLMAAVQILGKGKLWFGPMEIGAHSLCSGAAMAM